MSELKHTKNNTPIHFQIFQIQSFSGDLKLSADHSEALWITIKDLTKLDLAPVVKLFFKFNLKK